MKLLRSLFNWNSNSGIDFQPDADAIEKSPVAAGIPITLYALITLLSTFFVWAAFAEIDQVVVASGKLISTKPNIFIQPIETSQIESINVTVGQVVKAGDVLARLEPTFILSDLSQVKEKLQSLNAQIARLEVENYGKENKNQKINDSDRLQISLANEKQSGYLLRLKRLDDNIEKSTKSLLNAQAEVKVLEKRFENASEIEKMTEKLYLTEFQSRRNYLDTTEKRLEIERDLIATRNKADELTKEIGSLKADRGAYANEFKLRTLEELVTVKRERDTLQEQLNKSDKRSSLIEMNAPIDGVILEVAKRSKGSVIKEGETIVSMVPMGGELQAEIKISSSEVSFVKNGADVRVKIDSFPFQKFGLIEGNLTRLGADAIDTNSVSPKAPQTYYSGIVSLRKFDPSLQTPDITLKVGMSLVAEIMVQKRSILSYITYPIRQAKSEAMNER
jgi:HlyD family secretion protein